MRRFFFLVTFFYGSSSLACLLYAGAMSITCSTSSL
jgi:hypothetical protein